MIENNKEEFLLRVDPDKLEEKRFKICSADDRDYGKLEFPKWSERDTTVMTSFGNFRLLGNNRWNIGIRVLKNDLEIAEMSMRGANSHIHILLTGGLEIVLKRRMFSSEFKNEDFNLTIRTERDNIPSTLFSVNKKWRIIIPSKSIVDKDLLLCLIAIFISYAYKLLGGLEIPG
jgi:hypothetical protein